MNDVMALAEAVAELDNEICRHRARLDQLEAYRRDLLTPVANIPERNIVTTPCATCAEREALEYVQITNALQRLGMSLEAEAMAKQLQQAFPLDPRFNPEED